MLSLELIIDDLILMIQMLICSFLYSVIRVIKGTKIQAEIKRMLSRDKDYTWKTDKHNKNHKITKIRNTRKHK